MRAGPRTYVIYRSWRQDTDQFYIGCTLRKVFDGSYCGGGAWPSLMTELGIRLEKEVLASVVGFRAARSLETQLIRGHWDNPLLMNASLKGMAARRLEGVFDGLSEQDIRRGMDMLSDHQDLKWDVDKYRNGRPPKAIIWINQLIKEDPTSPYWRLRLEALEAYRSSVANMAAA